MRVISKLVSSFSLTGKQADTELNYEIRDD
jgi:hypothetical protein